MNTKEIFQTKKTRELKQALKELDAQISQCLMEQEAYSDELAYIGTWLDEAEHREDNEDFQEWYEFQSERYHEVMFLLEASNTVFTSLMKEKNQLLANDALATVIEQVDELHKRMAATEEAIQQLKDEQMTTEELFDSWND